MSSPGGASASEELYPSAGRQPSISTRLPPIETAPQARQNHASASGNVTQACRPQPSQTVRSSGENQARKSMFRSGPLTSRR